MIVGMENGYSTTEACAAAGISERQLDHWARLGLLRSSLAEARGSGSQRRWSSVDVATACVVGRVAPLVGPSHLGALVAFLGDLPLQQWAVTRVVLDAEGGVWLPGDAAPKVGIHVDLSLVFDSVTA